MSAVFTDAKAVDPGSEADIRRLTGGSRKSTNHRYLRLEKRLKTAVLLLTRTAFKDEGPSALVPKENSNTFRALLEEHRTVWPAALPVINVRKYLVIVNDKLHLLFL